MTADGPTAGAGEPEEARLMRRALALARRGWGHTSPNPLVGAVVAREGRVVGEGWHAAPGAPHAEVEALAAAGEAARGATLYVTLEPCAHQGRTPPCTEAILRAGVRRVVAACRDPHPNAGGGLEVLSRQGVEASLGPEAEAARRLNAPFLWRHGHDTPFVSVKLALSLDGRLGRRGERTAVSGPEAWEEVHRLRAGHDAVLVGGRTARIDDPLLTARGRPEPRVPPVRVVLDPALRLPEDGRLVRTTEEAPVWAVAGEDAPTERVRRLGAEGVRVLRVERTGAHTLDLGATLRLLYDEGVTSVLAEGGGRVAAALLRGDWVRRFHLIVAPLFLGDAGVPAFPGVDPAPRGSWRTVDRRSLGDDTLLVLEAAELDAELAVPVARRAEEDGADVGRGAPV